MSIRNAEGAYIGFDLGGAKLSVRVYDQDGNPLAPTTLELPGHAEGGPQAFLTKLGEMTGQILAESGLQWSAIRGVGVTIPAPLDNGVLLDKANLEHDAWSGWNAKRELGEYFTGRPVYIENDANAAVYGEWCCLPEDLRRGTIVVLTIGTGVGGGIIMNGELLRGQSSAGELGRVPIALNPYQYYRGENWQSSHPNVVATGTVESFASIASLRIQLKAIFSDKTFDPENRHPLREVGRTNSGNYDWDKMAWSVLELARNGDVLCRELFKLREEAIGRLFAVLGLVIDPHVFVVGGRGVAGMNESLEREILSGISSQMKKQLLVRKPYSVVAAQKSGEAGAFGAAMLVRDHIAKEEGLVS